jgi:hypothetical protein
LIKEASEALKAFVNLLALRPAPTLGAILIIFVAYISYRSYDTLQNMVITPQEESHRFKTQLDSAALVNDSIENLTLELNAHSVVIKQFHNGKHDLTGIPFTEATATFFTSNYEIQEEERLSTLNRSLRMMWREIDDPECIVIYKGVDRSTSKYFREYGLNRAVICPLTNLLNYPIGTITVGFSASDTSNQLVVRKTHLIAKRVTGYLNESF